MVGWVGCIAKKYESPSYFWGKHVMSWKEGESCCYCLICVLISCGFFVLSFMFFDCSPSSEMEIH